MSIFDQKTMAQHVQELDEHIQNELACCLGYGAHILESSDPQIVIKQLGKMLQPDYQVLGNGVEAERLKKQQGRPVIHWDATSFHKNDAIGSMFKLSKLPKEPKPVVIIENITEIPEAISEIYDDPVLVENVLLHSWKNDTIHLTHWSEGPFELNRQDYSVIFPVQPGDLAKLHHSVSGELALVQL